jgi:hypothetical protein
MVDSGSDMHCWDDPAHLVDYSNDQASWVRRPCTGSGCLLPGYRLTPSSTVLIGMIDLLARRQPFPQQPDHQGNAPKSDEQSDHNDPHHDLGFRKKRLRPFVFYLDRASPETNTRTPTVRRNVGMNGTVGSERANQSASPDNPMNPTPSARSTVPRRDNFLPTRVASSSTWCEAFVSMGLTV